MLTRTTSSWLLHPLLFAALGVSGSGCASKKFEPSEPDAATTGGSRDVDDPPNGAGGEEMQRPGGSGGTSVGDPPDDDDPTQPAEGKSWLFVGQDMVSIDDYAEEVAEPQGIVGYTSLAQLEGLTTVDDEGGGPNHMHGLSARYPEARIAIGLYLVDYLPQVNSGNADDQIDNLAEILRSYDRPVLLRIGYEFDGAWTHYDPQEYKDAYRRIADGIRDRGADQVAFVWQSAALCEGRYMGLPLASWYPGDDYVDWVGLSYFTQIECDYGPVHEVTDYARRQGKPLFVAEATPQRYDLGELTYSINGSNRTSVSPSQIWEEWFEPFFDYLEENSDVIGAVAYINADWDTHGLWGPPYSNGYWGDTRVQANPEILQNWQTFADQLGWN